MDDFFIRLERAFFGKMRFWEDSFQLHVQMLNVSGPNHSFETLFDDASCVGRFQRGISRPC